MNKFAYGICLLFFSTILFLTLSSNEILSKRYAQVFGSNDDVNISNFLDYEFSSPLSIKYPNNWNVIEITSINGTLFEAPVRNIGVIVQFHEINGFNTFETTNISSLQSTLGELNVENSTTMKTSSGSIFQNLTYSYVKDSIEIKVMQLTKNNMKQIYSFTYFSPTTQYYQFLPFANAMYNSLQSIIYQKVFGDSMNNLSYSMSDTNQSSQTGSDLGRSELPANDNFTHSINVNNTNLDLRDQTTLEYLNPYLGISASYPINFQKNEFDNGVAFISNGGNIGFTIGYAPSMQMPLDSFANNQITYLNDTFEDFKIINSSVSQIYEEPTLVSMFSYSNNSIPYIGMMFITVDENNAYIFTYFAKDELFNDYLDAIVRILNSIELRNIPKVS
jgi:hypothetical protein